MAATPTPTASSFFALRRRPPPALNFLNPPTLTVPELALCFRFPTWTTSFRASSIRRVRASEAERDNKLSLVSAFQEDGNYLGKLAIGSVIGAAIIKYGCIILPDITRPDIVQALLMISAPMVASVILLYLGSRQE